MCEIPVGDARDRVRCRRRRHLCVRRGGITNLHAGRNRLWRSMCRGFEGPGELRRLWQSLWSGNRLLRRNVRDGLCGWNASMWTVVRWSEGRSRQLRRLRREVRSRRSMRRWNVHYVVRRRTDTLRARRRSRVLRKRRQR